MLCECKKVRRELRRLVGRTTNDVETRKDLVQDAVVHLWKEETERPGRTKSWYLQSCYGHIRNRLRKGRSLNSEKRASDADLADAQSEDIEGISGEDTGLGIVCARDILSTLWRHLGDADRAILIGRLVGLNAREIGDEIGLTHPTVYSHGKNIAKVARRLGISQ